MQQEMFLREPPAMNELRKRMAESKREKEREKLAWLRATRSNI